MKNFFIVFLSLVLLLLSYFGYKHFSSKNLEFDSVSHYAIADEDVRDENLLNDNYSHLQSAIIYDDYPYNLDFKFHEELTEVGFKKSEIDKAKFSKLKDILKYEFNIKIGTSRCLTTYRDILVFQRNNKIVGVVKICFGCHQYCSIGENLPDFNFEKYTELETLLKK
ncbi:hypothetical protein [Flavobacterium terrigena]|uniref:Uncharacterized protein n=1 Tax=Flavobacterium terrigena TaxID=402734 RepID=A0A1H6S1P0_9FLAO|nr:hypothetical protein [Flavobacterium terrigena]SEI61963.1 hypothetical protein SAMN05660918_1171 [Flavobacterium terrigena]